MAAAKNLRNISKILQPHRAGDCYVDGNLCLVTRLQLGLKTNTLKTWSMPLTTTSKCSITIALKGFKRSALRTFEFPNKMFRDQSEICIHKHKLNFRDFLLKCSHKQGHYSILNFLRTLDDENDTEMIFFCPY